MVDVSALTAAVPPAVWAAAGGLVGIVALGWAVLAVRTRRSGVGRHRPEVVAKLAVEVEEPAGDPLDEAVDELLSTTVESDAVTVSPLTGQRTGIRRRVPTRGQDAHAAPAPRRPTERAAAGVSFTGAEPGQSPSPAAGVRDLDDHRTAVNLVQALQVAWQDRDVAELAAVGAAGVPGAAAGWILAAAAAQECGDPRAAGYLEAGFDATEDPAVQELLTPYRAQARVMVDVPGLGLAVPVAPDRAGVGLALAASELAVGDPEAAYSVLLQLPDRPLVRLLRAEAALLLEWHTRARSHATDCLGDGGEPGEYAALLALARGVAAVHLGEHAEGVEDLGAALDGGLQGPPRERALLARARALGALDRGDEAWADLTELLADSPGHEQALALMKHL
jgi:hypothetical protein